MFVAIENAIYPVLTFFAKLNFFWITMRRRTLPKKIFNTAKTL
jgi:hypothetical protein